MLYVVNGGDSEGAYYISKQTPIENERDSTCVEYTGNATQKNEDGYKEYSCSGTPVD